MLVETACMQAIIDSTQQTRRAMQQWINMLIRADVCASELMHNDPESIHTVLGQAGASDSATCRMTQSTGRRAATGA